jgi:hypothetical protein
VVHCPPGATQVPPTQQPSPRQTLPSQHGAPGVPHTLHVAVDVDELHAVPEPVQNVPLELEPQQLWPAPPQLPHPPYWVCEQVPASAPQLAPAARQVLFTQHASAAQPRDSQQGWPTAPQLWNVPLRQTVPAADPVAPLGTQMFQAASRQEPSVHEVVPGQGRACATPHTSDLFSATQ